MEDLKNIGKAAIAAIAFAAACGSCFAQAAVSTDNAGIDSVLRRAVEEKKVPNVVAMVFKEGHVTYTGAFGNVSDTGTKPVATDTIYRIASMSKPVTAVAVMQLIEAGKVKLDEPAGTYLPEIAAAQVIDHIDPTTGAAVMRAPKTPVTVRELLSNTSGYAYERWDAELVAYHKHFLAEGKSPSDYHEPLMTDPRTRWEYGTSTTWLGRLVEAVSGQTLEAYFRQHIFDPLKMNDTSFLIPTAKQDRLVAVHLREDDGTLKEPPFRPFTAPKFFDGGGGLSSTASDYTRFMAMILGGGTLEGVKILSPASVKQMETNQIGDLSLYPFKTTNPKQSLDGTVPGGLDKFGLGFAISSKGNPGGRAAGSIAWAGLDDTFFWIDPKNNEAAVIMMQVLPFLDPGPIAVLKDFEHAVYAPPPAHK